MIHKTTATSVAQTTRPATQPAADLPKTWIDPDTGHRVHRLSDEPSSGGLYFNINAYTPDGRQMVYSSPDGPRAIDLQTFKTRPLLAEKVRIITVGRKTPTLFFTRTEDRSINALNIDTGETRQLGTMASLPSRAKIESVNADETLAAGTYLEGEEGEDYGTRRITPQGLAGPNVQPANKAQMMEDRFNARLPLVLFTMDLRTGEIKTLLKSTDWINHLLFSPVDPTLLMYCHEGPWHKLDRIWTIRTDGNQNQLIHRRKMTMEISGHEFWGLDGKTIWYDLQTPRGEDFWLAAHQIETGARRWFHLQRDEWSIHFNITADETLICGDGSDVGQVARATGGKWIQLFRPVITNNSGEDKPEFIWAGVLRAEKLMNMSKHDYKQEPNVRFTPDNKMVLFTSNTLGESYLFGVEVEKAVVEQKE